jgi:hypothetical protein
MMLLLVLVGTDVAGTEFGPRSMALSGTGDAAGPTATGAGPRSMALSGTGTTGTPGTSPTGTGFGVDMATIYDFLLQYLFKNIKKECGDPG